MSWLASRWKGACSICAAPWGAGDKIWWQGRGYKAICPGCKENGAPPPPKGTRAPPKTRTKSKTINPPPPAPDAPTPRVPLEGVWWADPNTPALEPLVREDGSFHAIRNLRMRAHEFARPPVPSGINLYAALECFNAASGRGGASDLDWYGGDPREILEMLYGTASAAKFAARIEELAEDIGPLPMPRSIRRLPTWDIDGSEACWERWQEGHEKIWRGMSRSQGRVSNPIVKVVVNLTGAWMLKSEQYFWAGAVALAFTQALEMAGYRVQIDVGIASKNAMSSGNSVDYRVRVKDAEQPLNIGALAAWCCTPTPQRLLAFAWKYAEPEQCAPGLGQTTSPAIDDDEVYFNRVDNKRAAIALLKATLERYTKEKAA